MKCAYCLNRKTGVVNSRAVREGFATWRRRRCAACGRTFTTRETARADNLFVLKRNGRRQRFLYEKLFVSIFSSLFVRKDSDHGDSAKRAKKITERVIRKIFAASAGRKDVATSAIIVWVHQELKKIGQAYADHFVHYSDYRLKVALKEKLITL